MKGFKVIREDHTHHGFVYQEGLNVDTNPFRAEGSCVAGGLYFFTDINDIANWVDYGVYLYEVDTQSFDFVLDPSPSGNKYRSKGLFLSNKQDLRDQDFWINNVDDIPLMNNVAIQFFIRNDMDRCFRKYTLGRRVDGYFPEMLYRNAIKILKPILEDLDKTLRITKKIAKTYLNISVFSNNILAYNYFKKYVDPSKSLSRQNIRFCINNGGLELVKQMHSDNVVFKSTELWYAVYYNHFEIVKYLLEIDTPISSKDNPFELACYNGNIDIINLFIEKMPVTKKCIEFCEDKNIRGMLQEKYNAQSK